MRRIAVLSSALLLGCVAMADTEPWKGSIESSLTFISSNKQSESILLIGRAKKRGEFDRIGFDGLYNFSRQTPNGGGALEVANDLWSFGGRYERDFGFKSFWYGSARFDRDGVNKLDFRQVYGAGVGYTVFDQSETSWRVSLGVSQVFEEYATFKDDFLGIQAQSEYSRELSDRF